MDRSDREGNGWTVTTGATSYRAANVVVATGGGQLPSTPAFARELDPGIRQLHSDRYHNPSQLLPCGVLVVGAGHSGADLALEVAQMGHHLAVQQNTGHVRSNIKSRSARPAIRVLWFLANRMLTVGPRSAGSCSGMCATTAARCSSEERAPRSGRRAAGPARMAGVRDGPPLLEDGRVLDVSNVIWCTGFRPDFSWIEPSVTGPDGWPVQDRGVATEVPGLYFAGLLFQYSFTSMLVGGAGRDAAYIAHIARRTPVLERSGGARQLDPLSRATPL